MKTFRQILRGPIGRVLTSALLAATVHAFIEPYNYLYALEVQRQKEADIRAIAAKMNVDPEFLLHPQGRAHFDFRAIFRQLSERLGLQSQSAAVNDAQPLDIRESIKQVKDRYALVAADTTLSRIAQLVQLSLTPENLRGKNKGQIKAEMQSVLRLADKEFLPAVKDDAPGIAKSRDADMRREIKELQKRVKSVLNAPHALDEANLEATLAQLRAAVEGTITLRNGKPRWTRDPFPVKDTYRFAPTKPAGPRYDDAAGGSSAITPAAAPPSAAASARPGLKAVSNAVPGDVAALANSLGTPAKIFSWVHDNIDWESYSGVAKGSLGTLHERRGNDWDQALLLRDLLAARGYDARLEWGRVTLPMAKAMNLAGTEDPLQAANLLATAGFDGLVLTAQSQPIAIQMTHVWVRAYIPYIPNRGATAGTPDTWVRMDPSFKRYEYQPGIAINGKVSWNEDEYLQTSSLRPPADFYGDKIWSYIRSSNLDCQNLAQVTKAGRIKAANFPFVPATLTTRIESVGGVNAAAPAEQMQSVTMNVTDINGAVMASFTTSLADVWGRKLSITFPAATPEDAATIAAYGGLFNTPAYLIKLKPVFSIDDQPVADGSPVPAGAVLDLDTIFRQPNVADDFTHHELVAGETHTIVLDAGAFPDSLVEARINRLKTLTAEDAVLSEKLYLVGLRYMQHVDDGIAFSAGVRWQRPVKRVFEADVRRQLDITYNVAGAAVRLNPAENNIDVSRLQVGIVPINNDLSNRASALALAGLQSSYLEGAIWEEMESQQGISAAKALLLARMAGQQIYTVDSSNVNTVLNTVNLSADVEAEIRGAVAQGRIAKIPSANLQVNRWNGTGYILQDPATGAATYPISGGLAGGSTTGEFVQGIRELLGSESWLQGSVLDEILSQFAAFLGGDGEHGGGVPSTTHSDPVNVSSGNMHRTMTDVTIVARGITVALTRTYNSRSTVNGLFGYGWTFNYGESLIANSDGSVTYRESDGSEHVFQRNAGQYVSPPGKHLDLSGGAGSWTLTFKDGLQYAFNSSGALVSQTDLNGNRVTINRDANSLPTTVVDASGRTVLTFTVTGGKISQVRDIAGRTTVYTYSGDDLVSVLDTAGKSWTMNYDLAHNMSGFADPLGNAQSYDYDTDDRLFHHVDATGAEEFFQYDIAARQSVITDRRGGDRFVQFDDDGRALTEADPAGNVVRSNFDADNNRTNVVDSRGNATTYEFDADGNVTRQVSPDGGIVVRTYDANSHALTTTDANGATIVNSYDGSGNLLSSSRTVGGVTETTTNSFDSHGQLLSSTDPNGAATAMVWAANGTIAERTDAGSNKTIMTTDALGRIVSIKDPAGNETKLSWDGKDRLVTMIDQYNKTATIDYDAAGRRTSVTSPRGTSTYTFDGEGRILTTTDSAGQKSTTVYDAAGDIVARTDERGNTTQYEYDQVGRVSRMIDATGGVWTYGYCGSIGGASCSSCGGGSFCELTDPNGKITKQEFDTMGRVVRVVDSLGHVGVMTFDKSGRKTAETDANGNTVRYGYDEAGRVTSVTEASGAVTRYTYDKVGNKLTQKNANGNVWAFRYDSLNRLVEESDPLGRKTAYTYDALGNIKTKTDPKSQTITYTYNVRRLTAVAYPDGSSDTFTYDALGRRTGAVNGNVSYTYAYDALNRVTSIANNRVGYNSSYEYDAAGNRKRTVARYNNGSATLATTDYTYDAKNRLTAINDTMFGKFSFAYDGMDRRTELKYPNGIATAYSYDGAYRMTALVSKDGAGNVVDAWSYQYDAVGNRTSKTDMNGKAENYRYDSTYRLTEANYSDGSLEKFTYDAVGNRLTLTNETGGVTTYSYDVANQLLSGGTETFSYDANGNQITKVSPAGTTTVTYDANNRPTRIATPSGTEDNTYGPNGERMHMAGASIENGNVYPEYDAAGNPVTDSDGAFGIWTHRLYGPGIDEPLAEWRRAQNRITYLHRDALGSITAVSNTSGQIAYRSTYKAFGQMARTGYDTYTTRLGYTARETSVGGLMQYRSRYYDPAQGRFLQQDPYKGTMTFPPSLQQYNYVFNSPVNYTDPSGATPLLILGVPALIVMLTLYIALGVGLYHEFSHPRPGASTASRICIGLVKGFAIWGALFAFAAFITWLVTQAIVYIAYFLGEWGIFPIAMAYIWYYVQNHHIWTGIAFAVLIKVGFETIVEWILEEYTTVMEKLDYGASVICGAAGIE